MSNQDHWKSDFSSQSSEFQFQEAEIVEEPEEIEYITPEQHQTRGIIGTILYWMFSIGAEEARNVAVEQITRKE